MNKIAFLALLITTLASCSVLKTGINSSSNYTPAKKTHSGDPKFLDNIAVEPQVATVTYTASRKTSVATRPASKTAIPVENASALQLKYAQLLNVEVEQMEVSNLLKAADDWYGTPYRYGGTGKSGIDCSAFVQAVYLSAFAFSLPRTAREQYSRSKIISATDLQEGDLVFFNTTGGISHVGIYLQNNKFIHASASNGVTVSDLFDPYYLRKYIGAGRIDRAGTENSIEKLEFLKMP